MPIDGLPGGDFKGCVATMRGKMDSPEAFCAWKEHELTGKWPAEEALHTATVTEAHHITETASGQLTLREAKQEGTVLMDGVVFEFGVSANNNRYGQDTAESAIEAFAGKPIRINHPSRSEDSDRPEGNLYTQVGRLPGREGFYIGETLNGKGLCFKGAILSASPPDIWIADRIKAGIIGDMSINGAGEGVREADGVFNVQRFTEGTSLDLVTTAAAGGRAALRESIQASQEVSMDREEVIELVRETVQKLKEAPAAQEKRALLEAEMPPEETPKQEAAPAALAMLPEEAQVAWNDAYMACEAEGGEECGDKAWASLVLALVKPPEEVMPEESAPEPAPAPPVQEAPRPGKIRGMAATVAPAPVAKVDVNATIKESLARVTGNQKLAELAAKERLQ